MKYIYYIIFIFLWSSCISLKTVPIIDQLPIYVKGSTIIINRVGKSPVSGELIAVDEEEIIYLKDNSTQHIVTAIDTSKVKSVRVILSRATNTKDLNKSESRLIPLMTLGHGWWALFTLPINLVVISSANRKKYLVNINSLEELSKFARFPQGMPEGISLNDLVN